MTGYNKLGASICQKRPDRSELPEVVVQSIDLVALTVEGHIVVISSACAWLISLSRTRGRAETSRVSKKPREVWNA